MTDSVFLGQPTLGGQPGDAGTTAYELAVSEGYTGTLAEWLDSLTGKSAYEIWLDQGNAGTNADFLASFNVTTSPLIDTNVTAAGTVVDVFVYNTALDSDGGAWRERCQGTSWYNETLNTTTRGSRKDFPVVAVIVAETNKVTIYDGDDPSLPMWAATSVAFTGISCVSAKNGEIWIGRVDGNGVHSYSFLEGRWHLRNSIFSYTYAQGSITGPLTGATTDAVGKIVNNNVNDVAMTVLPAAPFDAATGLQIPTIAVATDGGVSVIKDDGTVIDATSSKCQRVGFTTDGKVAALFGYSSNNIRSVYVFEIGDSDIALGNGYSSVNATADEFYNRFWDANDQTKGLKTFDSVATRPGFCITENGFATIEKNGFSEVFRNPSSPSKGLLSKVRKDSNSGFLTSGTKIAIGGEISTDNLTESNSVINGDFSGSDVTQWSSHAGGTFEISSGQMEIDGADQWDGAICTVGSLDPDVDYFVECDVVSGTGRMTFTGTSGESDSNLGQAFYNVSHTGPHKFFGMARPNSSGNLAIQFRNQIVGTPFTIDNLSVSPGIKSLAPNGGGLKVKGTLTRDVVKTGAELSQLGGFTTANYLEQPYNSDLDFGTDDFFIMGWAKESAASDWLVQRQTQGDNASAGFSIWQSAQSIEFRTLDSTSNSSIQSNKTLSDGEIFHFCALRESGVLKIFINGELDAESSGLTNRSVDNSSAILTVGARGDGTAPWLNGWTALLRIAEGSLSEDQIRHIYQEELKIVQENAACTLFGTSDDVMAIDFDQSTGLLHAGTSSGRSVFDGLKRVENGTDSVQKSISAISDFVVEE